MVKPTSEIDNTDLDPCPSCNASGFVAGPQVPKRALETVQKQLAEISRERDSLSNDLRRIRWSKFWTIMTVLIVMGGLGLAAFPIVDFFRDKWIAERSAAEQQAQIENAIKAEKQVAYDKDRKGIQARWDHCFTLTGSDRCICLESTPVPDGSSPVDANRCWRDAAIIHSATSR